VRRVVISVHFPKSAGTSLVRSAQAALGEARVLLDYGDNPANPGSRYRVDPVGFERARPRSTGDYAFIHGHFHPEKYALIEPCARMLVTILREPVDNLLSIYRFWRQAPAGDTLHDYFLKQNLSPLELARLPLINRLMSETYFGSWDMTSFDFVGDYADYGGAVCQIAELLGVPLSECAENVSPKEDFAPEIRSELANLLAPEIAFYHQWRGYRRNTPSRPMAVVS
jgi:hypothetical protein